MSEHNIVINSLEQMKEAKQYWVNIFSTPTEKLLLPTDFERKFDYEKESISFELTGNSYNRTVNITKGENLAIYVVLLSVFEIEMFKYSAQEELTIGTTVYYKSNQQESLNTVLLMKSYLDENMTFKEIILNLRKTVQETYENQIYPLEEIFKHMDSNDEIMSLLPVNFVMKNIHNKEHIKYITNSPKNEMTFLIEKNEDSILFEVVFNSKLFKRDTVKRFCDKYLNISHQVLNNLDIKLDQIEFITEEEKQKILYDFNDTYVEYPRDKTIYELFEEQVEKTPDNVAVVFDDECLTYRELNERANVLAKILTEKRVKPDRTVGIIVERSLETIIGIIGILKAGGAYLPIDPEYPVDRILYMLQDSKTKILLLQSKIVENISFDGEIIDLNDRKLYVGSNKNLNVQCTSDNLSYVIYTSGTTGKPKGVGIKHSNITNYITWFKSVAELQYVDKTMILTSLAFDLSYTGFYSALLSGCEIHIIKKEMCLEPKKLINYMSDKGITFIKITPSLLNILINSDSFKEVDKWNELRFIAVGGENIKVEDINKIHEYYDHIRIMNHYGPTETTIGCIANLIDFEADSNLTSIGKPVNNTQVYVLDKHFNLLPVGVVGEICIGGDGVGTGYINSIELMAEKYIMKTIDNKQFKLYRTGDYGKFLRDGSIEFIGRIDKQIKIRGFRVEIEEIENVLLSHLLIKETVVTVEDNNNGDKYLCAYLVMDKKMNVGELRQYLHTRLADYMIPSYFVQLEKIPLTPNGKVDRKALPKPDGSIVTGVEYEAARNEVEEKLAVIWSKVLGIEKIGINDNFFELGGHSLKATVLSSRMHKELDVEVPLKEIFKSPTIKGISEYIESTEKSIYSSMEIVEEKEYYEASSAQKRMYMLQQFDLKSTGYNMPGVMLVEGRFEAERLEKSFALLIRRHETLRTSFETIEDKIVQRINESVDFKLNCFEVSCIENSDKAIDKIVKGFIKSFDLNKSPLLRVGIIKLEEDKHILMFDMHHIISDGISMGILINEFSKIYEGKELEKLRIQYKDYSQWQNRLLKSDGMQEQKEYWINRFTDEIPVLNMPTDFQRPLMQGFEGENVSFKLDKELTKDLKRISKETGSTMYMVILSGVNILLSKYSGQEDIIVGSPIAGRPHADLEKIIGIFVNTLAMRNYPEGSKIYEDFLKEVKGNALKAYENQDYQFDELVDKLSIPRDISRNPLFDVMFTMQNMDSEQIELKDLIFKGYKQEYKIAKFDLTFSASEVKEEIVINLQYGTKLYKRETIETIIEHFVNILKAVAADTKIKLSEIEMLTKEEKHKLLYEFNDTYADYPRDKTIHELFEEQVEKTPHNVAVVFENKKLTYRELNHRANGLARMLREKGVKADSIVGIMVERSVETIVGIIGILKSGGAYLPIDSEYPEDRIRYMIEDAKAKILLKQEYLLDKLDFDGEIINIRNESVYGRNVDNVGTLNTSKDLACVIYTSGSTGNPKGVMVEQKNVIRLVKNTNYISFKKDDKILQTGTLAFDASTFEIWGAILNGLELHLGSKNIILNIESMEEYINENDITILWLTASLFNFMAEERPAMFANLRYLLVGGDVLPTNHINKVIEECRNLKIINGYGPTENTTFSTCYLIDKEYETNIPIGRPISNSTAYIIDKYGNLQTVGIYGELCVGGEGLARGYLNNPELTAEKFIKNPFIGDRMYKTGDLARWLPDGNIEFLGRIDYQVKIRGFRIELGEIESQLLYYDAIKEAIVIDREDENGTKYLCAYLVAEKELTVGELRSYLSQNLPEYMIPSYFVQLEKMPLTPNGKIDRKALPKPDGSIVTGTEYEAPRNEVEEKLVAIWKDVLAAERVGINDNFFELGGHSLKATTLVSKMHKELNVEVPLREIFKFPTIKGTSEYIESTEKSIYSSIEIVEEKEYYEASSAQKRMYLLQQFDLKSTGYNMPGVMMVEGRLNVERLEKSFAELIIRHETLRTSFETIEGKIVQRVNECVNFKLDRFDVDCIEGTDKETDNIARDFVKAFELNKAPLLRVGLIKLEEDKHILMFDMHHIISDGVSMGILINEFSKLYEGNKLEQLRIQYKDYSQWQNDLLKSGIMQEEMEYWINRFKDEIPVLNMPTDFQRPLMQSFEGENISFKLDKGLTKDLKRISKETGSTVYMVLLSGVNILLSKYSGQEDIIVGSPIAGRPHTDLEKIIGMFVNTLAMRNHPEGSKTYEDFLKEVRGNALKAYENQDYQFDELVDKLNIPRDISRNPLFDVMFTMQNMDSGDIELKDLIFKGYKQENRIAKFDLTFVATEVEEEVIFELQYSTKLYKTETVERMVEHFVNIIKAITSDTNIKLSEIEMISGEEKHILLYEFNDTYADYPRDKTIHELFEEQVEKTPDNVAVVFEDKKLTYRELNEKANRLARTLRKKGVKPDSIVGIMVERSIEMIVGIMGILKAGGAYLPIDPEYPEERIKYVLNDSNASILLTQNTLIERVVFKGEKIDLQDEKVYAESSSKLENTNTPKDLAYVIYTSGSTGHSKGVLIEHKNVLNTIFALINDIYLNNGLNLNIALVAPYVFDASVQQIFPAILLGHKLLIVPEEARTSGELLLEYYNNNLIDISDGTPIHMSMLVNARYKENTSLNVKCFIIGGDVLSCETVRKFFDKFGETKHNIVNIYGPTECCVDSISYDIDSNKIKDLETIPIGKPMSNESIYILGKNLEILPVGIVGEIYIAGKGVGRGYLNNPDLTAEKFIKSPFVSEERMYKTGDLARWLPDGNIEFLGRIDHQVKIRGFRIELGEIESQLLNYESVKAAIVLDREDDNGIKYLCAYLVSEKELTVGKLREYLSKKLPEYMIPSYFVQLEKIPITPNGKIDRKALPEPDGSIITGIEYEAPRNEVEEKLVAIWKEVLATERVGINDNFFELGGHSLKATTLVSKIHKELNVEVPLREIFKSPTIKGISEYIESTEKSIYSSIEIVKEKEYYEASSAQKRMYMLQQFDLKSIGYNMPGVMQVEGRLNVERLEKSFVELIRRHETLRTSFETIEDKIVQRVNESVNFKLNCFEVGRIENQEKAVDSIVKDFIKAFDLNKAPLLRVGLIKLEEDKHILIFDIHHIISDGVSMGILINEFSKNYEGIELEQLRIQYKDYSEWQNSLLKSDLMKGQREYWTNIFKDEIPVLNMPTDFQRPLIQSFDGENISFKLDKELTKDLKRISKETGSTMYMVILSGVNILLSKYSGQEDIIVGSPIAGRPHADLEKIMGIFINTLAMRNHLDGSKTYEDFLKEVRGNALKAYENQDYQFDELVDKLSIPRDIGRNPLFDVMFTMQNMDSEEIELKGLVFKGYNQEQKVAKFDLTFSASEMVENIILNLQYSTKLYKRETIETMIEHFINILKAVSADTKIKLSEIEMLTEEEKYKLLYEFNDTYAEYSRDRTIHELFEEQVEKSPDNIAIVFEDKKLTYRELNEKANRLARNLRAKGVKPDSIVGIMVERSFEMIVGIMGILKAGGAYLPIDPEYPVDRISYMLEDSKIQILLTQQHLLNKLEFDGEKLNLSDEFIYAYSMENLENINTSKDLVYIIYTSGSTGNPKGVMVNHKALNNFGVSVCNRIDLLMYKNILCLTTITFDIFALETLVPLLKGIKIVIADENEQVNSLKLNEIIIKNNIEVLQITPSRLQLLMLDESFKVSIKILKIVMVGGESFPKNLLKELNNYSNIKIYNMYGPTETTVWSSIKDLTGSGDINIGKPISNTQIYIIDKTNALQPIGMSGELCISGDGLARGYLNRPELTAEKFIESPFVSLERMYKTGDLARWLPDGNIEFLGRIDHQVKVRGFRIEPGEIESRLLNYEDIKEAIVLDREAENGAKYLCAYLVSKKELTVGELREYLSKKLPEYMIPSYFVQLDKMPLTPNGKIDRKALPKPDGSIVTGAEYEAARNEIEEKLVEIWKNVLSAERVGINDNFFELGGHSLKATTLVSKIHKELDVEVTLGEIFKSPTIKGISEYIESTEKSIYSSIEIVEEKEYYEASSAQKRMYMLQQFDLKSTGYNMPGVMLVEGRFEAERLEKSFALLIRRHETLRTSFETIEGKIVQRINESVDFKLNYFEVSCIENSDKAIDKIVKDFVKAFDLNNAPLLRVGIINLEEEKHILMFDMHHIISDGVSMGILINEFAEIYEGNELEQLRIQYKDYSQWQNSSLKSAGMQKQKEYWINRFTDEIPVLNMPTDFQRPLVQSFEGANINFKLDKEITKNLKQISKKTGSTMYMVLLSGVNILLSKYSGQEDIIVGSPIAGRPHADLEKIIGIFVNTLIMRNHPDGSRTYEDFLKEVKGNALKAYENQDYQFDELVDRLSIPRDISRSPLFDVMFTMQNIDSGDIKLKDLILKGYKQEHKVAKFDLTFLASEVREEIILNLEYSTKLYKRETIERMVEHFVNIIKVITGDIKIKLGEIEMMTEGEKHKLLNGFNDTYADYPRDKTIHELFEEQVEKTPDNIAIVFEDKRLTYSEVNERANKLARNLRGKGVKPDSIVGIMVERSVEMIVGIMGVLKAGGAYLPIDSEYPEDRIKYMIEDSNIKILLTQSSLLDRVEANITVLDIKDESVYAENGYNLEHINTSKDLAYVIYTSGSTGNPKGTEVIHYNVSRVVKNTNYIYITKNDIILQLSNYAFDGSVFDIYGALLNGAKLILIEKEIVLNTEKLSMLIVHEKVSVFFVTTALFNILVDNEIECFNNIRKVMFGGERISISHAKKALEYMGENRIIHVYGPTESTVFTTYYVINDINENTGNVSIGSPIANTKIYIIGKNNKVSPIGIPGELCIAGEGLARGYLNNPELTAEKFTLNLLNEGERIYKTGDLARWLPDGNIEFLGRIDHQVKIRGFRIELGEIESQLLNYEEVIETVVIDREDENAAKYLCAYLVLEKELTVGELRAYLSKKLPEYMIPSYFVQLEKMPLTQNGKIDRKALPKPDGSIVTGTEYEAPRNEVEEKLAVIWSEVLGVEKVGINDNFFELGGHSLKATTLVSKMHKELNVEVPLREIFKSPTIKGTSKYIESTEKSIYSSIEIVEEKEYYEASSAQKRMYLLQQFDLKSTGYNMPGVMMVEGRLNVERLEKSFAELIIRHETLRTSFETIEGKIVQRVNEGVNFKLDRFDVDCIESTDKEIDNIVRNFVKAFELNKAPLLRVGLIKLKEEKYILMFDMHHIISDGVSMGILTNEFAKIYEGNKLEQLRIQYKDYSQWQNNLLKSDVMQEQKEYWTNIFKDEIPVLNMPTDFKRPLMQSFEGKNISFKLDKVLTKDLKRISKETVSTMYMVLLSGVNILLSKYSGQEDIIVGSTIAGRPHADIEKIIGMFVNTLAMRNHLDGSKTYEYFLNEVKENALKAYENQDYQFDELVDKLNIPRDISRNPLFDVMFTMQNMDSGDAELKDLIFKGYKQENRISKFDLTFVATEVEEEVIFELQYGTKLYKTETVERMVEHFVNILKAVATDIKIKLNEIDMLTEEEKCKLLFEFNDTYADYPRDKTIHELFEEQAQKTPDNIAIVLEDKELTYREINERANRLARNLRERGVKSDSIVGIMVVRSIEMIVGIIGVLKAGGAYLPIDPEYPEDRIGYMLRDSGTNVLLVQRKFIKKTNFNGEIIDLEDEKTYVQIGENLENVNTSKNLAYLIYTSGSTGMPKGVMIEHKSIINTLLWRIKYYKFGIEDAVLQIPSFSFDSSVEDIFTPLLSGAKLILIGQDNKLNLQYIETCIKKNNVGYLLLVPSFYRTMLKEIGNSFVNMKGITVAGESFTRELAIEHYEKLKNVQLYNEYGPTENSVCTSVYKVDKDNINTLIGRPINNVKCHILSKNSKLIPIGVEGELCVSGEGLARGYLSREELTSEKFIANSSISKERIYKTGDLARWLPDGNIEFLGRVDQQVKIRGFRIELGEIESNILTYEAVLEVVVIAREDEGGNNYLCAYLISEQEITVGELREHLLKKLPEYMMPSYFMQIEKMPLTPNGKIDRKALPKPDGNIATGTEYEAPRNEVEENLVKIWSEVLGVEKIGINDNFFELGGHSLKATILVGKIYKEFNVEVPLKVIFKIPTIKDISKCLLNKDIFTAYKDYSESEVVIKLNDTKTKNIFLFPPIIGYGITYKDFAKYMEHHTLYSFDFIEDENRIKEYVKQIVNIQKGGKYILMGYSAGGNLAFEVTKELENSGYEVDHIILLDSNIRDEKIKGDSENLKVMKGMVDGVNEYARINAPFMLEYISENVQRKLEKFTSYLNELINEGKINANINLILSSSENIDEDTLNIKLKKANEWADLTKKCFKVYQGYGKHNEMTDNDNVKLNAQIINGILMQQY
ncbi:non-ribosomal peptide synthase/polyketide synthase [Clostridium sp. FP1]|uniref:non-ribosomal peptide synthase/polyketide synthase n=1 Tax=Clostridium sp. FP1 TaxID=2724076 RepID=UPI0013E98C1D|nr:non-ribosomal peptide synthase/polyketide synthase [Clostridium sp. FP1]MBZ9636378.1 non-ribosomal peptide synthase/polyketide synthase [Clostridium sp. FP1]